MSLQRFGQICSTLNQKYASISNNKYACRRKTEFIWKVVVKSSRKLSLLISKINSSCLYFQDSEKFHIVLRSGFSISAWKNLLI